MALKVAPANLIHKSDAGVVVLGLGHDAAVWAAWAQIAESVAPSTGNGARSDAGAGDGRRRGRTDRRRAGRPAVRPGRAGWSGGVLVELLHDVQLALAPIGPQAAEALLRRLRFWPLLAGVRGRPALDIAGVVDVVSRVSWLAWEQRERLAELDINPLLVREQGVVAVDARAVVSGE